VVHLGVRDGRIVTGAEHTGDPVTSSPETSAAGRLSHRLEALVLESLEALRATHLREWRVPGTFGGHPVEPDVAADLVFTLSHLHDLGVEQIAGEPLEEVISSVLRRIDGRRTHTFFSYRVAETLGRFGRFDDNPLMDRWSDEERANVATAVDSTDWIELLEHGLPQNYAAVLARCETARHDLGLPVDHAVLADLVARTRAVLGNNPDHHLDDSTHGVGRYDIYSADVWLFTEPLAPLLGELWFEGVAAALGLVEAVAPPDGSSVCWGRSAGVLGLALTLELAALVLAEHPVRPEWTQRPDWWLAQADASAAAMPGWFDGGLISAHQHRSPYAYRGPFRRLQMTLDVLGKLAWAAARLRSPGSADHPDPLDAVPGPGTADRLVRFETDRPAGVWSADDGRLGLVVPFVGATTSDYLAAPRRPGLWEVPIDAPLVCWVPMVVARHRRWAPTGIPDELHHGPWRVEAGWQGLGTTGELDPPADAERLGGTCHMAYELRDRSVHVEVQLQLDELPDAVGVAIPEAQHRPLRVEVTEDPAGIAHLDLVDTDGIAEWRSYHGELPVVHQIDLDAARTMSLGLRVTPTIRVASTAHGHHYDRSLYGPLEADRRAVSRPSPLGPLADPTVSLADVDVFHLHWPEWLAFGDLEEHRRIADELEAAGVPVVWTVHNLTPHEKRPEVYDPVYQLWAERAAVAIHHSAWGEARVRDRYRFGPSMRHAVVPHGHFGDLYPTAATPRDEAAARLGLPPAAIRIGVLGAPRVERRVGELLAGLVASANAEVQVCCWSLAPGEEAPTDDRLAVAEVYEMVDPGLYGLRAAACDLLALPFDPDGEMLSTGVAADVVGLGLGALVSDWGYLGEVLGDAGIPVGHTAATIADALDRLTPEAVAAARSAARDRRDALAWSLQAERTFALLDSLL
jgi:hypothetical protein